MNHCTFQGVTMACLCAAAVGCSGVRPDAPNRRLDRGSLRGHNVLVVTIDTLRADRVGAYAGGALTPAIDRLAASGVRFAHAYAHAPLTLPAHTSIFTGLAPPAHGIRDNGVAGIELPVPTLAERLRGAGYRTAAFVGAFVLDARFGLNRGFDVYDDHVGSNTGPVTFAFAERTADRVTRAAGDWLLDERPERGATGPENAATGSPQPLTSSPWFVWVHLFDPHAPYRAPEARASHPYDNEVAFADAQLGAFVERLRAAGRLDRTLIVVLADHGESLGEHGEATHGLFAYNATLGIPLVVAGPQIGHQVVDTPAAQFDVLPTILDLLGIEVSGRSDGRSLLPAMRGEAVAPRAIYFEALDAYLTRHWAPLTGTISGDWKYIDLPEAELYDLARDPQERQNVIAKEGARVAAMQQELARWSATANAPARGGTPLDPDAAARLRALGYAGVQPSPPARRPFGVADDPKRLLDLDRRYEQAMTLTGERRYDEAVRLLQAVIAERPDFTLAYTNLASVLIESGHARDAIVLLEEASKRGIRSPEMADRLGAAHLAADDPAGAVRVLEPAIARSSASIDALNTLGIALSALGRHDRARPLFEQALRRSPGSATTWNNLGLLELAAHRPAEAARAFEQAVAADAGLVQAWRALGAARARSDPSAAIAAWKRALALEPRDYDLLFNLAVLLHEQGAAAEARPYVERFVREAPPSRYGPDIATLRSWLPQSK